MNRYIIAFYVGNFTNTVYTAIELQTLVAGSVLAKVTPWVPTSGGLFPRLIQNGADNGLRISNVGAGAAQTVSWCVIYADAPPGILSTQVRV